MGHAIGVSLTWIGILLEMGVLITLVWRGYIKRLAEVAFYLLISLGVIGLRTYTFHAYGYNSSQYGHCYWTTDLLLVLAAFVLVTCFFKRACSDNREMWRHLRLLLGFVLALVAGVSLISLSSHDGKLYTHFIIEFSQNLYFTCLVLTTLLYLLMTKIEVADERLGFLVCGLGIQFAGPAACLALLYLAGGHELGRVVGIYLIPLCDVGMGLTWLYAIARVPGARAVRKSVRERRVFTEESMVHS